LSGINTSGDTVNVTFNASLSSPDSTTLNGIVSSYYPRNIVFFSGVSVDSITYQNSPYFIGLNSVSCDTSGGNIIILLRQASTSTSGLYAIEKRTADANTVTILAYGNDLINGSSSAVISTRSGYLILQSNGFNWISTNASSINQTNNVAAIDMRASVTNIFYDSSISASQSITSTIYVVMKTITPPAGTYSVNFSSSLTCSTSATINTALVLGIGPSALTSLSASSTTTAVTVNFASQAVVVGGTGGVLSSILYVTSVTSGNLAVGQYISGTGIISGTTIVSVQIASGGTGVYVMSVPNSISNGTTITGGASGYVVGQNINVSGFTPSAFNGAYQISVISPTSIQYSWSGTAQSATVQGAINPGGFLPVTAATSASNVVTLTFSGSPITAGFSSGQQIVVSNFSSPVSAFNGTWTITSLTSSTIVYTSTSGGNATASSPFGSVGLVVPGASRNSLTTTTAACSTTLNKNISVDGLTPVSIYWNSTSGTITCKGAVFNMTKIV
jgi:hypothetical protein